jgi:hypothetical protein
MLIGSRYFRFEMQQDHTVQELGSVGLVEEPRAVQVLDVKMSGPDE